MKRGLILAVAAAVLIGGAVRADEKSHKAAAEKLLEVTDAEKNLQRSIDLSLEQQLRANPQLAPAKEAMKKFFNKHLSYAALKDDLVKMYTEEFTEEELKKVVEFYSTPAGKKMAAKQPTLMQKGGELGMKRVQDNADELRKMIEEELRKK